MNQEIVMAGTVNFDGEKPGELPAGWVTGVTGSGTPRWAITGDAKAPSPPNVHVARANALEDNVSLYHTTGGRRNTIKYVHAPVAGSTWHVLRVEFAGSMIRVALDGKTYIESKDSHVTGAGAVGVWTKADSITSFDDFKYGK